MTCACERGGETCPREAQDGDVLCDRCVRFCARLAQGLRPIFDNERG